MVSHVDHACILNFMSARVAQSHPITTECMIVLGFILMDDENLIILRGCTIVLIYMWQELSPTVAQLRFWCDSGRDHVVCPHHTDGRLHSYCPATKQQANDHDLLWVQSLSSFEKDHSHTQYHQLLENDDFQRDKMFVKRLKASYFSLPKLERIFRELYPRGGWKIEVHLPRY